MSTSPQQIDYEAAYASYIERFTQRFGERPLGAFVKCGKHMVQKLGPAEFRKRLDSYLKLHKACKKMIDTGSTISDALVLDFAEASAWIVVEAPDMHRLFRGELGDPGVAAPTRVQSPEHEVTDPDLPPPPLGGPLRSGGER